MNECAVNLPTCIEADPDDWCGGCQAFICAQHGPITEHHVPADHAAVDNPTLRP